MFAFGVRISYEHLQASDLWFGINSAAIMHYWMQNHNILSNLGKSYDASVVSGNEYELGTHRHSSKFEDK